MIQYIVFLGATVQLIGVSSYIKDILRGNTKPNKVTWLMWSIAPLIASFAAFSGGAGWTTLPIFMSGFGPLLVLIASFYNEKSYWKIETFDYFCGLCSLSALIFWIITKNPAIAIIFAIIGDGFAAIPTLMKSWKNPETETVDAYTTGLFNALTGFFAIKLWNFSSFAFPIYLVVINTSLIITIKKHKILKHFA